METKQNKIKVIVAFRNASEWLERCINSIMTQKYDNFEVIFVDDVSTDNSWDKLPHSDKRALCIKNTIRKTALENLHDVILQHCEKEDIVMLVDGDDALLSKNSLSFINDKFNETNCWFCYGQATWSDGRKGCARPMPLDGLQRMRTRYDSFYISHLRTFKAGLYHKIQEQDSTFSCMKDKDGKFYRAAYDVPMCLSMCELAGLEKIYYNEVPLYWYNLGNPESEFRVIQNEQTAVHLECLKKPPFKQIYTLD